MSPFYFDPENPVPWARMGEGAQLDIITYNIPCDLVDVYGEKQVVVRSPSVSALVKCLSGEHPNISSIQLISLNPDDAPVKTTDISVPVDLVLKNPEVEYPLLYHWAEIPARQPVRASIPVVAGFDKAVRLAASLDMFVTLTVDQPDDWLVAKMRETLEFYLHTTTVSHPIDFYHSLLMAFYHGEDATMWRIQEEDPTLFRHIAGEGKERLPGRFAGMNIQTDPGVFMETSAAALVEENEACRSCEFKSNCFGYFKWPRKDYDCKGVKTLFHMLKTAAEALENDLTQWSGAHTP